MTVQKKVKAIVTSHMCIHSVPANCISTSLMWLTNSRPWSVIITLAHPNLHNTFCYLPWRHVIISIIPAHCLVDELCYSICWLGWQSSCFWPFGKVINHCYNELITTSSNRKRTYQVYSYLQRNIVAHFNMLLHTSCMHGYSQITLWTTLHLIYIPVSKLQKAQEWDAVLLRASQTHHSLSGRHHMFSHNILCLQSCFSPSKTCCRSCVWSYPFPSVHLTVFDKKTQLYIVLAVS